MFNSRIGISALKMLHNPFMELETTVFLKVLYWHSGSVVNIEL